MNWNISAWAIRRPIPSLVLFLVLLSGGLYCFYTLGIDEDPNIDLPYVTISASMAGAAPSEIESQITRPIESAVVGLGAIKHVISTVRPGSSTTSIEFVFGTNTDRACNDVRNAVTRVRQLLPASVPEPSVQRVSNSGDEFARYAVACPRMTVGELSWLVDNDVSRAVMAVPGVGAVNRRGGVDREIHVDLDPLALEAVGLTADGVSAQIHALNINLPGGRGNLGGSEQIVRTLGSATTVADLAAARISLPAAGGWARLDSLGAVRDTTAEPRSRAFIDGRPAVMFGVERSLGSNMVAVANGVETALTKLRARLPQDVNVQRITTDVDYVMNSYHDSLETLILGALLAVLVIWLFLRDTRAAVISALAMPISVIPTFMAMRAADFTLNSMSLLGLSLVIGILVDDAIVEIENIVRHIHMGKNCYQAAIEAADEIGLAVVACTMTIIVVFLPVAFMGGIPGQYFKPFGLTVAMAVFFSLVVARLLTPLMAAYWMGTPRAESQRRGLLGRCYDHSLIWVLRHRFVTVGLAVAFFGVGLWLFKTIPTSLMTSTDRGRTLVNVTTPPGTTLDETAEACLRMTRVLQRHKEVDLVYTGVYDPSDGYIRAKLKPRGERKLSEQQFEDLVRPELRAIPGARADIGIYSMADSLSLVLASEHDSDLRRAAEALLAQMRTLPEIADVSSGAAVGRPEIEVMPDLARASEQGVSVAAIANTAQIAALGDVDANLPRFDLSDRQIYIRVELDPRFRQNLNTIRNLKILNASGQLVPLQNVASVRLGTGEDQIKRYDRCRQISLTAALKPGTPLGTALKDIHALSAYKNMPPTVRDEPNGNIEIQNDVFNGFGAAMALGVLLIYAVLCLLFNDFLQPLTIMASLPLSITGALLALVAAHQPLGMFGLIGLLMLMGLVTKNAILLVEYCMVAMQRGIPRAQAIVESGRTRMRPIVMTSVAMIAGMLPIALGIGAGSEERAPMALTVIGGLVTSTLLTLLVVPVVFTLVDDVRVFLASRFGRRPIDHPSQPHSHEPVEVVSVGRG